MILNKKRKIRSAAAVIVLFVALAAGQMTDSKKSGPKQLEDLVLASGRMPRAGGGEVTVELCMKNGIYYDDTMDEYFPSIYAYEHNYEGNYVIRTVDEAGTVLCERGLEELFQDRGEVFNFPQEFALVWEDYNADGCPDFTIGQPQNASNMRYMLLTVREDGAVERLCRQEISETNQPGERFSVILEHGGTMEKHTITSCFYNNVIGEVQEQTYEYRVQSGMYEII